MNYEPKYIKLKNILSQKIYDNYSPGSRFPTDQEIMTEYNLSNATVSRAMKELVSEGLVKRKRKEGTFVVKKEKTTTFVPDRLCIITHYGSNIDDCDPMNSFIQEKILKGIINNYPSPLFLLSYDEFKDRNLPLNTPVIAINPSWEPYKNMVKEYKAHVIIDMRNRGSEPNTVTWDSMTGIYELMEYLIVSCGHRRIGFIYPDGDYHLDRYAGYQIALRTYGIKLEKCLIEKTKVGGEIEGYKAAQKLLSLQSPPSAIFADTDLKAIGALEAIHDAGLSVDDISIAGFDDNPKSAKTDPPLTTIRIPLYEIGKMASKLSLERQSSYEPQKKLVLPTELIVRESCKPPIPSKEKVMKDAL